MCKKAHIKIVYVGHYIFVFFIIQFLIQTDKNEKCKSNVFNIYKK